MKEQPPQRSILLFLLLIFVATTAFTSCNEVTSNAAATTGGSSSTGGEPPPANPSGNLEEPLAPLLLISTPSEDDIVNDTQITVTGSLTADNDLSSFVYNLNDGDGVDILDKIDADSFYEFTISDLVEGDNIITLTALDTAGSESTDSITIIYSLTTSSGGSSDGGPTTGSSDGGTTGGLGTDINDAINQIGDGISDEIQNSINQIGDRIQENIEDIFTDLEIQFFDDLQARITQWLESLGFSSDTNTSEALAQLLASLLNTLTDWANNLTFDIETSIPTDKHESNGDYKFTLDGIRGQMNGMDKFANEIFPSIASQQMMNAISIDGPIELAAKSDVSTSWDRDCSYDWFLKASSILIKPELDSSSLVLNFQDDKKLHVSFRAPDASVTAALHFNAFDPAWLCLDVDANFNIAATDLKSSMDLSLALDSSDSSLSISVITNPTFSFLDEPTITNLGALEGMSIPLFLNMDDPAFKSMGSDNFTGILSQSLNELIKNSFQFSGSSSDPVPLTYEASMDNFTTSADNNTLLSTWDIDIDTEGDRHSCAHYLTFENDHEEFTDPLSTRDDFTLEIPHNTLEKAIYGIGQTGIFCQELAIDVGVDTLNLQLNPHGTVQVEKNNDSDIDGLIKVTIPYAGELDSVNYPIPEIPQKDQGFGSNGGATDPKGIFAGRGSIETPLVNTGPNDFQFNLILYLDFDTDCQTGLSAQIEHSVLENLTGTIKLYGNEFDVQSYESILNTVFNSYFTALPSLPITPKLLNLEGLDGWVGELDEIDSDNQAIHLGLNLVEDDYCGREATFSRHF